jgi:hypothetical protein
MGFEQAFLRPKLTERQNKEYYVLRSWVQIPPGPLFLLYNYGIELRLIQHVVGQIQQQCH